MTTLTVKIIADSRSTLSDIHQSLEKLLEKETEWNLEQRWHLILDWAMEIDQVEGDSARVEFAIENEEGRGLKFGNGYRTGQEYHPCVECKYSW